MIVKCKICGKEFEAQQRNHNLCSDECRKISLAEHRKIYLERTKEERNAKERKKAREKHDKENPTLCRICSHVIESHITGTGRYGKYRYHRDCLINEAIAAILRGEKFGKKNNILAVASNKGFQKSDLLEIMKERGIKYGKQKPFAVWRG